MIGHKRVKNGKEEFVHGYWKGALRGIQNSAETKENNGKRRQLVTASEYGLR